MALKHRIARILHALIVGAMWLGGAYIVLFFVVLMI